MTGILIPAATDAPVEQRKFAGLEDFQVAVGGWIEAIDLPSLGVTIYVNEEGLLQKLPLNSRASFLWWFHVPAARQKAMLVGDAVVVGCVDQAGNSTDVPQATRELLLETTRYRVEMRSVEDSKWYRNQVTYPDYWEAIVWGMVLLERWSNAEDVRVVPDKPDEIEPDMA